MEERTQETEKAFNELNPTSISRALGFFKWVLFFFPKKERRERMPCASSWLTVPSVPLLKQRKAPEQHGVMPSWRPVPIVNSDELLALKTNLNATFNDIATANNTTTTNV